ncbi:MAG: hypothetical protein ACXACI_11975 [Candidatus Hodarchaeales archaeon]|jgi:hypothetical protein
MATYRLLTAIQAVLIFLCGFSLTDFGVTLALQNEEPETDGLFLNNFLFDEEDGLPSSADFLADNDYWGYYQFWGLLMIAVGVIQIIKAAMFWDRVRM